jgi:hypothetical protein
MPVIVVFIMGCTTSRVMPAGEELYIVSSSGAGFSSASVRENVYASANKFCSKKNQTVKSVNLKTREGRAAVNPPSAELTFRCVRELTDLEVTAVNNKSLQCLVTNTIVYDDGISDVGSLSKAIMNQCYKPCVKDKSKKLQGTESNNYNACLDDTVDMLYTQRNIKRQGGDFKQFLNFTYAKRRGDGHFQNRLYTFDKEYKSKLILSCSVGENSALNTHSLSFVDNSVPALHISKDDPKAIKLLVNGSEMLFFYDKDNNKLSIPLVDIDNVINSESLLITNGNGRISFKTSGYMDALNKMKSECPTMN